MNIKEVGDAIRASVRKARSEGMKILPGWYGGRDEGQCCAIGAYTLDCRGKDNLTPGLVAARMLDVSFDAVYALWHGFDLSPAGDEYLEFWELGQAIRGEVDRGEL